MMRYDCEKYGKKVISLAGLAMLWILLLGIVAARPVSAARYWAGTNNTFGAITIQGYSDPTWGGALYADGVLTINGTTIRNNSTTTTSNESGGGAIYGSPTSTININSGTISNNSTKGAGGAITVTGNLTIANGTIAANTASFSGGAIMVYGNATITGGTIGGSAANANKATYGGGIFFGGEGKTCTISGGNITYNQAINASGNGGGVHISHGTLKVSGTANISNNSSTNSGGGIQLNLATATISGGTINNNTAAGSGGGIAGTPSSVLTVSGGTIAGNTAGGNGGGIYASNTTTINGGTIGGTSLAQGNKAVVGGGIFFNGASKTMAVSAGNITFNQSSATAGTGGGGGIYVNAGTLNVSSTANISSNKAVSHGGGIYSAANTTTTISGGTITANTTNSSGGGIYANGNLTISGGSIASNTASSGGGGVYANADLKITGGTIGGSGKGNKANNGGGIFFNGTGKTLDISKGDITYNEATSAGGGIHVNAGTLKISGTTNISNNKTSVDANASGTGHGGGVHATSGVTINMSGGTISGNTTTGKAENASGFGGGILTRGNITMTGGTIGGASAALGNKGSHGGGIWIAGDMDMSGGNITYNESASNGGGIVAGGKLVISGNAAVNYNNAKVMIGGINFGGSSFELKGGTVSYNTSASNAGGIYIGAPSIFTMTGGTVAGNTAVTVGGGFHIQGDSVISGGTIGGTSLALGNKAATAGGIFFNNTDKTLEISGGTISYNQATAGHGGGVYIEAGTLKVSGTANISNNSSTNSGGGIFTRGNVTITGGTIGGASAAQGNKAAAGGGISFNGSGKKLDISKGDITYNQATGAGGGGIFIETGTLNISGTANISNNTSVSSGGGILGRANTTININGGTISNNTSNNTTGAGGGGVFSNGDITIINGLISNNSVTGSYGGGVNVYGTFKMSGGTISGNTSNSSGGGIASGGNVTISGGTITANTSGSSGGGMVSSNGNVTITGGTIGGASAAQGNKANNGAGIFFDGTGKTLAVSAGNITFNQAANGHGGGIYVDSGTLNVSGTANISDNTATLDGGGVYSTANTTINISGGVINSNTSGRHGGGVYVGGVLTMTDGVISNNTAALTGGGIYSMAGATVNISGGTIAANQANSNSGGGILAKGNVTISGGTIGGASLALGNKAGGGGGVYFDGAGKELNISGGNITFNEATNSYGGGVGIIAGTLKISGNTNISNNKAYTSGGGIYTHVGITTNISGGTISANTAGTIGGGIYVRGETTITGGTIGGASAAQGNKAASGGGIYFSGEGKTLAISKGDITYNNAINGHGGGINVNLGTLNISGTANISNNTAAAIDVNMGSGGGIYGSKDAVINISGGTIGGKNQGNTAVNGGGVLAANITVSNGIIAGNTASAYGGGIFAVGDFTMTGGTIGGEGQGNKATYGGGVFTRYEMATLDISGGNITYNQATTGSGGGIFIQSGLLKISGNANISHNQAAAAGGGIYANSNVTVTGGVIANNTTVTNGGGITFGGVDNVINISGGNITGNKVTAGIGGGLYIDAGTLNVSETANVSNNVASNGGGGIYAYKNAIINISGGTIAGNTANMNGGGIYSQGNTTITGGTIGGASAALGNKAVDGGGIYFDGDGKTLDISSGNITYNQATGGSGGGVNLNQGTLNISGTANISNNTAVTSGGGIYGTADATINISGGTISANNATGTNDGSLGYGGGIYALGNVIITGGAIGSANASIGNKALSGGGIYFNGTDQTLEISGGDITYNEAVSGSGGGIHVSAGKLNISGTANIGGNTAATTGGGIFSRDNITITGGTIGGASAAQGNKAATGGGIYFNGAGKTLEISNGSVSYNESTAGHGGGIYIYAGTINVSDTANISNNMAASSGGGIYGTVNAVINISGGVISGNTSNSTTGAGGGGVFATGNLTMTGGVINNNSVTGSHGGGVFVSGDFSMSDGVIADNTANSYGGGVNATGNVTITGGTIGGLDSGNTASRGGGMHFNGTGKTLAISNGDITYNQAANYGGGLYVNAGTLNMSNSANVSSNKANMHGGGIYSKGLVNITGGVINENIALQQGGGIVSMGAGDHVISNVTISGNSAGTLGGGIYMALDSTAPEGSAAALTMDKAAVNDNSADTGAGMHLSVNAAAITNTKVTGNVATGQGGGMYATVGEDGATISDTEFTGNTSGGNGGGGYLAATGDVTVTDSKFNANAATAAANGVGLYLLGETIAITGSEFNANTANDTDNPGDYSALYIDKNGMAAKVTATLSNNKIMNNQGIGAVLLNGDYAVTNTEVSGNSGLGFIVANGGLVLANVDITGNGGGIAADNADVTLNGVNIINNAGQGNSAITVANAGKIVITDAEISGNRGGGIDTVDDVTLKADGNHIKITNNLAETNKAGINLIVAQSGPAGKRTVNINTGDDADGVIEIAGNRMGVSDVDDPDSGAALGIYIGSDGVATNDVDVNIDGAGTFELTDGIRVSFINAAGDTSVPVFTMNKTDAGAFNWGGVNDIISQNAAYINLNGGLTTLADGFVLNGYNGDARRLFTNVANDAALDVAGTATFNHGLLALAGTSTLNLKDSATLILGEKTELAFKDSAQAILGAGAGVHITGDATITDGNLDFGTGQYLSVDSTKKLTLDAQTASLFTFNNSLLNIGVSTHGSTGTLTDYGQIVSASDKVNVNFTGHNIINLSDWAEGDYDIVKIANAVSADVNEFTVKVGGNDIDYSSIDVEVKLVDDDKTLRITTSLHYDNAVKVWGGQSGDWDYLTQNWAKIDDQTPINFFPLDAAWFNLTDGSSQTVTLTGQHINASGMLVEGDADYVMAGAALHINSSNGKNVDGMGITWLDKLVMAGSGTLTFDNGDYDTVTAKFTNINKIQTIEVTNGTLVLGDGFAVAAVKEDETGSLSVTGANLNIVGRAGFDSINVTLDDAATMTLADDARLVLNTGAALNVTNDSVLNLGKNVTLRSSADLTDAQTAGIVFTVDGSELNTSEDITLKRIKGIFSNNSDFNLNGDLYLDHLAKLQFEAGSNFNILQPNGAVKTIGNAEVQGGALTFVKNNDDRQVLGVSAGKTLTLSSGGSININGGVLDIGLGADKSYGRIVVKDTSVFGFANQGESVINLNQWVEGTYDIITSAQVLGFNADDFTITINGSALDDRTQVVNANFINDGKTLQLVVYTPRNNYEKVWTGAVDNLWDYTTENWALAGADSDFYFYDAALFNLNDGSDNEIEIAGKIMLSGMKVEGDANYTFTGGALVIDSSGSRYLDDVDYENQLLMAGTGTLTLKNGSSADANVVDEIIVSSGTLAIDGEVAVKRKNGADKVAVTIGENATLLALGETDLGNMAVTVNDGTLAIGQNSTLGLSSALNLTLTEANTAISMGAGAILLAKEDYTLTNAALTVGADNMLRINADAVLTINGESTLAFNNGMLSIGLNADGDNGLLKVTGDAAPAFSGTNIIGIQQWLAGEYVIVTSETAMDLDTNAFNFKVGGNDLDGLGENFRMLVRYLDDDKQALQLIVSYATDNGEKVWGGQSGVWDYATKDWTYSGKAVTFLAKDVAWFDGSGDKSQTINITGGAGVVAAGMKVDGDVDYTLTGAALNIDDKNTVNLPSYLANSGILGKLVKTGTGTLTLNTGNVNGAITANHISHIDIMAGVLALGSGFTLKPQTGENGVLNIAETAELKINDEVTLNNISLNINQGALTLNGGSRLNLENGSSFNFNNASISLGVNTAIRIKDDIAMNGVALNFGDANYLSIADGKTLTLDNGSTLSFTGSSALSLGISQNGNGKIVVQNTANNAVAFTGSNITIDLKSWVIGEYDIVQAGGIIDVDPSKFKFTIGGNQMSLHMDIIAKLSDDQKTLTILSQLTSDNLEKIWNGDDGDTWNYSDDDVKWKTSEDVEMAFLPNDAAKFDSSSGASDQTVNLGGDSIDVSGIKVEGDHNYTFTGGAINIDDSSLTGDKINDLDYLGSLVKEGDGTLTLATGDKDSYNTIDLINVNEGDVVLGGDFNLKGHDDNTAEINVADNAGLVIDGTVVFDNVNLDVAHDGSLTFNDGGHLALDNNSVIDLNDNTLILSSATEHDTILEIRDNASINGTHIIVREGGVLSVNDGKTLNLDDNTTLTFQGGTYDIGIKSPNSSGLINSANTGSGSVVFDDDYINNINIQQWQPGEYTVITADSDIEVDLDKLKITVNREELDLDTMAVETVLSEDGKSLIIKASINVINTQKIWNGETGVWNYSNTNWVSDKSDDPVKMIILDAVWFDGRGAEEHKIVTLNGDSIDASGIKVSGDKDYTFAGAAFNLHAQDSNRLRDVDYENTLLKQGTGKLTLNNGNATYNNIADYIKLDGGTLALGDGFVVTHGAAVSAGTMTAEAGTTLEILGKSTFKDYDIVFKDSGNTLDIAAQADGLHLAGAGSLNLGSALVQVNLNRQMDKAAITVGENAKLYLDQSVLRLVHTGTEAQSGSWLIVAGNYFGHDGNAGDADNHFRLTEIGTITLKGDVFSDTDSVWFEGSYTPYLPEPSLDGVSPNGKEAFPGLTDLINNGNSDFVNDLSEKYGSAENFNDDIKNFASDLPAEGAVTHARYMLDIHRSTATSAINAAFNGNLASAAVGPNINVLQTAHNAGNTSGYGILSNWQPANTKNAAFMNEPAPEHALNAIYAKSQNNGIKFFGTYLGHYLDYEKRQGYDGFTANFNGFLAGAMLDIDENVSVGAYGGYAKGKTEFDHLQTDIDSDVLFVGLLGRYTAGAFKLTGDFLYTYTENDVKRTVPFAVGPATMSGSYDQHVWGVGLEAAYDWTPLADDPSLVVTPYAAFRFSRIEQDGFTEKGDLPLDVGKVSGNSVTTNIGVKVAKDYIINDDIIITPKASIGWVHEWDDKYVSNHNNFIGSDVVFATRSIEKQRDALQLGASVDLLLKEEDTYRIGIKAAYGGEFTGKTNSHSFYIGLELSF